MNTSVQFPDNKMYDLKPLIEFIFEDYGSPYALPGILDDAIKQITLSEEDNGTETVSLLFGLRDAFSKVEVK